MNSSTATFEPWFIPGDALAIVSLSGVVLLAGLFVCLIILEKTCHTVSMMLIGNSCLIALMAGCCLLNLHAFALYNDVNKIQYQDSLCVVRGYTAYVSCALFNYSFLIQAIYRYVLVVHPKLVAWQSMKCQVLLVCMTWIGSFVYPLPFMFTGEVIYNGDNQICQLPFRLSFAIIYLVHCAYLFPVALIMLIYLKLVRYVKQMSRRVTFVNTLRRAQRELKMVRHTVIIVTILVLLCLPYAVFIFIAFFTTPPKYHFRIAFLCADVALLCVMIALLHFVDPLKASMVKRIKRRTNAVM